MELYRGELLPWRHEEWIPPERQRLAETYFQAVGELIRCLEERQEMARALDYARRAVSADPLREEAHRELIRLLIAAGQPEAARRHYQRLEQLLAQELGAAPAAETRHLARQLAPLTGAGTAAAAPRWETPDAGERGEPRGERMPVSRCHPSPYQELNVSM